MKLTSYIQKVQQSPIVRYDCAHGFFHRDLLHPDGTEEKLVIEIPKLKFGLKFAKKIWKTGGNGIKSNI